MATLNFPKYPTASVGAVYSYGGKTWNAVGLDALNNLIWEMSLSAISPVSSPLQLSSYVLASLPVAASYQWCVLFVTNLTGGAGMCYSDGTNWRRVSDGSIAN